MRRLVFLLVLCVMCSLSFAQVAEAATYNVNYGDSLFSIGQKFGVSYLTLEQVNGLGDLIYPGQTVYIPDSAIAAQTSGQTSGSDSQSGERYYSFTSAYYPSNDEIYLLARLIYSEAKGEPFEGQVAVGAVVMNRVKSPLFPDTISDVIFELWQFEPVLNGAIWQYPNSVAIQAARYAVNGWDPTGGALYFFNPDKVYAPFFAGLRYLCRIGGHEFYTVW